MAMVHPPIWAYPWCCFPAPLLNNCSLLINSKTKNKQQERYEVEILEEITHGHGHGYDDGHDGDGDGHGHGHGDRVKPLDLRLHRVYFVIR